MANSCFSKSIYLIVLTIFISPLFAASNQADHDARQWLLEMRKAMKTKSFHADVAYLKNNQIETMRVTHAGYEGGEREHILTLSGPMREVIREPDKVTCYFPESKTKITNYNSPDKHSLFSHLPKDLKNNRGVYRFILTGSEQVAGRMARKISIIPNDSLRYGQKIWIDRVSKLPLKYELFKQDGKVIEQMVFTSISLKQQISPRHFSSEIDARGFKEIHHHKKLEKQVKQSDWFLSQLPVGFEQLSHTAQISAGNKAGVEHLILSDGLISVSVYIEENSHKSTASKAGEFGAVNGYMRTIHDFRVTVVGEVPAETVKLIGHAVQRKKP